MRLITIGISIGIGISIASIALAVELPPSSNFDAGKMLKAADLKAIVASISELRQLVGKHVVPNDSRGVLHIYQGPTYDSNVICTAADGTLIDMSRTTTNGIQECINYGHAKRYGSVYIPECHL